jgi:hypothetical protein
MKSEKFEFLEEVGLLLKALEVHNRHFKSESVAVSLSSLIGALCDVGKLSAVQFQCIGCWILEGGFLKEREQNPQASQVQKILLPPEDGSQPTIAYLRMNMWSATQVEALHLQDKVTPLENIERLIPPARPEDN